MNLAVHYISGDLTVRSLQTCFSPENTGGSIAEGLRESLAWILQEDIMVCIHDSDIGLSNMSGSFPAFLQFMFNAFLKMQNRPMGNLYQGMYKSTIFL